MAKLCAKGKAAAKRKFKVYPSAYANMYGSAVCSGKVTPGGKKKRKKAMGIPKETTKSDYLLKNKVKKVQKSPDKDFKYNNPETKTVKSDRTGKVSEVNKSEPVKGSVGKKKYIKDMKRYHHQDVFGSNKIRDIQGAKDGGRMGYKNGSKCKMAKKGKGRAYGKNS